MLNDPITMPSRTRLDDLGVVRVQGPDAVRFLQGQLSHDVALLSPSRSLLAGLHNPQGRVIAVIRLLYLGADDVLGVLPRELAASVATRLAKYVLRAKVKVSDVSLEWQCFGVTSLDGAGARLSDSAEAARRDPESSPSTLRIADAATRLTVRISDSPARWLEVTPLAARASADSESGVLAAESVALNRDHWRALDIAAGLPQVYAATSEQFVAQMLNLDVVDAISFTKGCYTGQEVIARAHYRGRVKRRMQRFRTLSAARLAPNDTGVLRDGRSFRVVDAAQLDDGRCEFLAVTLTTPGEAEPADAGTSAPAQSFETETLALPYDLPA